MNDYVSVPSHYTKLPIIAVAKKNGGIFIDGDWIESKDLSDSGFRYLTTGNVGTGEFKDQGTGYISESTFHRLRCTEVMPGDILVSRRRCCRTIAVKDSHHEFMRLDGWHEQAQARPLPHH